MDWLTVVHDIVIAVLDALATSIAGLAWPIAAVLIAWILRTHIRNLVDRIESVVWGDRKLNFRRQLEVAEEDAEIVVDKATETGPIEWPPAETDQLSKDHEKDYFQRLVEVSPRAAVSETWHMVEREIRNVWKRLHPHDLSPPLSGGKMLRDLKRTGELPYELYQTGISLASLRNEAVHSQNLVITESDARRYCDLALALSRVLRDVARGNTGSTSRK